MTPSDTAFRSFVHFAKYYRSPVITIINNFYFNNDAFCNTHWNCLKIVDYTTQNFLKPEEELFSITGTQKIDDKT